MLYVASAAVLIFLALTWQKVSRPGKIFIAINIVMLALFWGMGLIALLWNKAFRALSCFQRF
ncbi:hypothetical protein [Terasakiella sp.]|uniref:hypothetical protein n=1 Tax=Terasakiella sp. TaxID=2034861 RepID=UPI003AFFE84F